MLVELYNHLVNYIPFMASWHMAGGTAMNINDINQCLLGWAVERTKNGSN